MRLDIIKRSRIDRNATSVISLNDFLEKTEGKGYHKKETVEIMLAEGLEVGTPFAIYKAKLEGEY